MSSPIRFIPEEAKCWTNANGEPIAVVETTIRTLQGRYFLKPTARNRSLILGVLGRAKEQLDFELYGYAFLSNHGSMLIGVRDAVHLARIMEFIHSNIARELGRKEHSDWPGPFWARRGKPILVLTDVDLVKRQRYLLANSTKENLVARPTLWPGAHCARALCEGRPDTGAWVDRTLLGRLRRQAGDNQRVTEADATTCYRIRLNKLPCWGEMSDSEYRQATLELCQGITEDAERERANTGASVMGEKRILRLHPHHRPTDLESSPAPPVHCSDTERRHWFIAAYRDFVEMYQAAHEQLRRLVVTRDEFPYGGIPPTAMLQCAEST